MTSTSDTSAIDEKKGEDTESEDNFEKDIGKFLVSLLIIVVGLLIYFSLGSSVLYACKIAQSNILPTDEKCMPYESREPNIQPIQINIFETMFKDPALSQKISFSYSKNNKNTILDILRDYKQKPDSHFLVNYFISIMESLFTFNFSALNTFLNLLNQTPEFLIIIFGPIIMMGYTSILLLIEFFYVIYLWFYKMSWFFSSNLNSSDTGKPKWESSLGLINLFTGSLLVVLFIVIFLVGLLIIPFIPFIAPLVMIISVFTILSCKGEMNDKAVSILSIIMDVFKYNKLMVTSIITFFVILCAFATLGGLVGGLSILTVVLIYFGILSIDIFNPINEDHLSKVVSYNQAKKTCKVAKEVESKGFISSMMPWSGGGKKLVNEIKKIGKKM